MVSDGTLAYCSDGTHLGQYGACQAAECSMSYKWRQSYCIPIRKICDGDWDCLMGDDEEICKGDYVCTGMMHCLHSQHCIPMEEICDGIVDCPISHHDERYCHTCPQGCTCHQNSIDCSTITKFKQFRNEVH